jgi:hypothetical protein
MKLPRPKWRTQNCIKLAMGNIILSFTSNIHAWSVHKKKPERDERKAGFLIKYIHFSNLSLCLPLPLDKLIFAP